MYLFVSQISKTTSVYKQNERDRGVRVSGYVHFSFCPFSNIGWTRVLVSSLFPTAYERSVLCAFFCKLCNRMLVGV